MLRYLALFNFLNGFFDTHQTQSIEVQLFQSNLILKKTFRLLFHRGIVKVFLDGSDALVQIFVVYFQVMFV